MSAAALANLGSQITALEKAIQAASTASTFNMRPAINAVLLAALNVQKATGAAVADLEQRTSALEGIHAQA